MSFLMFAVWLILNGKVTMEICLFGGVISAALLLFMFKFMDYSWKKELLLYSLVPFFAKYTWVLIEEIVKANTLTPGTITVSVEDDTFCVHCLDTELAEGLEDIQRPLWRCLLR